MERFAQAALGKLRQPQLPLPAPPPPALPAAPDVLRLVVATSVLVALSEEREALLELAATDRRTAMKNSWEGLAKGDDASSFWSYPFGQPYLFSLYFKPRSDNKETNGEF